MISARQNEEITRVGPGTPAGRLLRHYWMPAALSDELVSARPVVPVTLLGEELVLFRDAQGRLALLDRHCPHRGADLSFGRLEDGGLRCPFHGWLFDCTGQCLEQPAEPEGSRMHRHVRAQGYPVIERNGVIFAYMGPGEPPPLPALDCFVAPDSHVFAFKGLWSCNWLQALEVGIDPAHASFLHRFLEDEDLAGGYGQQFRDAVENIPMTKLLRDYPRPDIRVDRTGYGMRLTALRHMADGRTHVRVTNQVFPVAIAIPMSNEMTITQWHVPIDDVRCYWYAMFTSFARPVDKALMREQRLRQHRLPDYMPLNGKANNYGYDPEEQERRTWTGMGDDINVHDQWACESMGAIQDRTKEHLGKSDIGIVTYRRMLREAMAKAATGEIPPFRDDMDAVRGPLAADSICATESWERDWTAFDAARRAACPWDARLEH
ncbi:MAG: aromatic ring-hydroxylating dioxygenase subunit alpha [Pseudomonadota bacterium]|nr:aromatic ring-hydroxylating dioxygenase subunit alpha [Pseudomonadota bacterium]